MCPFYFFIERFVAMNRHDRPCRRSGEHSSTTQQRLVQVLLDLQLVHDLVRDANLLQLQESDHLLRRCDR
jgi:hypothetical protein